MKAWLQRFMYGRYGQDGLGRFLTVLALIVCVVSTFAQWAVGNLLSMVLLAFCIFRMFSRNTAKRAEENVAFLRVQERYGGFFRGIQTRFRQRKTHRYYRCPSCKQQLRVPRGKGNITIHCPKCKASFDKRT